MDPDLTSNSPWVECFKTLRLGSDYGSLKQLLNLQKVLYCCENDAVTNDRLHLLVPPHQRYRLENSRLFVAAETVFAPANLGPLDGLNSVLMNVSPASICSVLLRCSVYYPSQPGVAASTLRVVLRSLLKRIGDLGLDDLKSVWKLLSPFCAINRMAVRALLFRLYLLLLSRNVPLPLHDDVFDWLIQTPLSASPGVANPPDVEEYYRLMICCASSSTYRLGDVMINLLAISQQEDELLGPCVLYSIHSLCQKRWRELYDTEPTISLPEVWPKDFDPQQYYLPKIVARPRKNADQQGHTNAMLLEIGKLLAVRYVEVAGLETTTSSSYVSRCPVESEPVLKLCLPQYDYFLLINLWLLASTLVIRVCPPSMQYFRPVVDQLYPPDPSEAKAVGTQEFRRRLAVATFVQLDRRSAVNVLAFTLFLGMANKPRARSLASDIVVNYIEKSIYLTRERGIVGRLLGTELDPHKFASAIEHEQQQQLERGHMSDWAGASSPALHIASADLEESLARLLVQNPEAQGEQRHQQLLAIEVLACGGGKLEDDKLKACQKTLGLLIVSSPTADEVRRILTIMFVGLRRGTLSFSSKTVSATCVKLWDSLQPNMLSLPQPLGLKTLAWIVRLWLTTAPPPNSVAIDFTKLWKTPHGEALAAEINNLHSNVKYSDKPVVVVYNEFVKDCQWAAASSIAAPPT